MGDSDELQTITEKDSNIEDQFWTTDKMQGNVFQKTNV